VRKLIKWISKEAQGCAGKRWERWSYSLDNPVEVPDPLEVELYLYTGNSADGPQERDDDKLEQEAAVAR